jgi:hypothetical protein
VEEAKNAAIHGRPECFSRETVARICKRVGHPKIQERWVKILKMFREHDPDYFRDLWMPPKPGVRLVNEMKRIFRTTLPIWQQCKDLDVARLAKQHHPPLPIPAKYGSKRRKSYPHNYSKPSSLFLNPQLVNFYLQ